MRLPSERLTVIFRVSYPGAETSTFHLPPMTPRIAQYPFLFVFVEVPPPFSRESPTVASAIGWPVLSLTQPSTRAFPRQSCAQTGETARAPMTSRKKARGPSRRDPPEAAQK